MKKSIIAASAASLAVAALPIAGVFAATSNSFTDTLHVGVAGGCTLEKQGGTAGDYSQNDREFSTDIAAGNVGWLNASSATDVPTTGTVSVSCNTSSSTDAWTITVDVTDLTTGTATISGGIATSGATSGWAIKSNATGTPGTNPFQNYAAAADGTFLGATANQTITFNPSYQVYVAPNQAPGTYNGTAVYEIDLP